MGYWMRLFAVLVASGALLLAGCGDDDGGDDAATSDTEAGDESDDALDSDLIVADFEYELQPVPTGAEVSFANLDSAPHTLTARDDTFDTGTVAAGDSTTFTAPAAGEYEVFCTIHPSITGTLVVEE